MGLVCGKCGKHLPDMPSHGYAALCTECAKVWDTGFDGSRGSFYHYRRSKPSTNTDTDEVVR